MTVKSFPSLSVPNPSSVSWKLLSNTQTFTSPLSGVTQTLELPGARWQARMSWEMLTRADERKLNAFLASLRGRAGRFYLSDLLHPLPSGTARTGGTATTIAGATTATISGLTGTLLTGDKISIGGELKILTADSAGGSVTFEPPMRGTGGAVVVSSPTCVMMLDADDSAGSSWQSGDWPVVTLACTEAFQ